MGVYLRLLVACQVLVNLAGVVWERYRVVLLASVMLPLAAVAVDLLDRLGVLEGEALALTPSSPWGVITSAVVHGGFYHLYGNLQSFSFATMLVLAAFMLSAIFIDDSRSAARTHVRAFTAALVLSQALPALRLYVEAVASGAHVVAYGLSQVVFGLMGLLASTCAALAPLAALTVVEERVEVPRLPRAVLIASSSLLISSLMLLAVGFQEFLEALGMGMPTANVRGHVEAFVVGLVVGAAALGWGYSRARLTLAKLRRLSSSLGVEEARRRVIMKISRMP
ncbi:MAG: hypothetical protein J7L75_02005 [Thermoproteales archaeon]|nr:hypothetical protein [Thermoproteales archaeon]